MAKKKIIIMGAAGRDFHNFNTLYRKNNSCGRYIRNDSRDHSFNVRRVWASNVTPDWGKVTCKLCLRQIPPTIWERIRPTAWERIGG